MLSHAREKLDEAEFFLGRLRETQSSQPSCRDPRQFGWYLSAFLTSARSGLQILCPKAIDAPWKWIGAVEKKWPRRERNIFSRLTRLRNISVHEEPVKPGSEIDFLSEFELSSRYPSRPRHPLEGYVIVGRVPGSTPVRVGVTTFLLDIAGRKVPAVDCSTKYLELVRRLVDNRERTKNKW
jgi:hypothetical protein